MIKIGKVLKQQPGLQEHIEYSVSNLNVPVVFYSAKELTDLLNIDADATVMQLLGKELSSAHRRFFKREPLMLGKTRLYPKTLLTVAKNFLQQYLVA